MHQTSMSYQHETARFLDTTVPSGDDSSSRLEQQQTSSHRFKLAAVALLGALATIALLTPGSNVSPSANSPGLTVEGMSDDIPSDGKLFDSLNRYVLKDYDNKKPFSDFLAGVGGIFGIPLWSFFVNRGQGIASFGIQSKDYPLMKFSSANLAYQMTPFWGFRTFIQGQREGGTFLTEPFDPARSKTDNNTLDDGRPDRYMYVGVADMEIQEIDNENGVETKATYFLLPDEPFGSFVRRTTITNIHDSESLTFSMLDGLAKIEPKGGPLDNMLNTIGRTLEGWFEVLQYKGNKSIPLYKMSSEPSDSASVKIEEGANFAFSYVDSDPSKLLPYVFDSGKVFGQGTSLEYPRQLETTSISDILNGPQYGYATTSSAFAALESVTLAPGESITIASFFGSVDTIDDIAPILETAQQPNFVTDKLFRARQIIDELTAGVTTKTGSHLFNGHVKQMFIDNGLRGGIPLMLGDVDDSTKGLTTDDDPRVKVFHTFSRIHGDLERDYNWFSLDTTYFSQGPGNYRDVAQNRRNDVVFQPRVGSFDVLEFLSFIQADAYEPLTVEAIAFKINDRSKAEAIANKAVGTDPENLGHWNQLVDVLSGGFVRPGQLFSLVQQLGVPIQISNWDFINMVLAASDYTPVAQYGTGYWADHWDYYVDLIEAYLMIFPDKEEALMYGHDLKYFYSPATVRPRSEKYVLDWTFDYKHKHVQQLDATYWDESKVDIQKTYLDKSTGRVGIEANWQSSEDGEAFTSSPIVKLFLLGSIKYATRDAYGMGVEYEGGRPGWNDAMNGLVGMVGSGMPETYELIMLLKYVKSVMDKYGKSIVIPAELGIMVDTVNGALDQLESSGYTDADDLSRDVPSDLFDYWNTVATARETYRASVKYSFSGSTTELTASDVSSMISRWLAQIDLGVTRAFKIGSQGYGDDGKSGISPCYFSYNVTDWKENGGSGSEGRPTVDPLAMSVGSFPLFLEGPVRYSKTIEGDLTEMSDMYDKVLNSGLRDSELSAYYISASLEGQNPSMGRMMAFAPGWLENQSIWTHMSYKYYLQLIRGGLYENFFSEMKNGGMLPFQDPDVYGRSLMECSSFVASSAFPDPERHGEGFLARLSGSTAEFLSMYVLMMIGPEPFLFNSDTNELQLQLVPALPQWLFEDDDGNNVDVSFLLFSAIEVTYHNKNNTNLYRVQPTSYTVNFKDGTSKQIEGPVIGDGLAEEIRRVVTIDSIDVYF